MRILKNRSWNQKIKFPISLCISFFIGSVLGGVITNLLSRELLEQIGSFDLWYEQSDSLIQNLKKRLGQFMMVCLGGMTGFSGIWFYLVFLVMGAGAGIWIATLTLYGGWKGIFLFAVHMMPQWSCYGTLCLFLAAGSRNGLDHMKLRGWVLMVLWLFLGVLIEYQIGKI